MIENAGIEWDQDKGLPNNETKRKDEETVPSEMAGSGFHLPQVRNVACRTGRLDLVRPLGLLYHE